MNLYRMMGIFGLSMACAGAVWLHPGAGVLVLGLIVTIVAFALDEEI